MFVRIPYFDFGFEWGRKSREAQDPGGPDPTETNTSGFRFLGITFVRFSCRFEFIEVVGVAAFSKRLYIKAGMTTS